MDRFLKYPSYLFHPIWMPFVGSCLYFLLVPRFFPEEAIRAKLMALAIISLFIPIVFFFMLRTLGKASSYFLEKIEERKVPLVFYAITQLVILRYVLNRFDFMELYHFYTGILISTLIGIFFIYFKIKISLHITGLAGVLGFIAALSYYYQLNLIYTISLIIVITGLTATSRLHFKAHTQSELIFGFLAGLLPQIFVLRMWMI